MLLFLSASLCVCVCVSVCVQAGRKRPAAIDIDNFRTRQVRSQAQFSHSLTDSAQLLGIF